MKYLIVLIFGVFLFAGVCFALSPVETARIMVNEAVEFANVNGKDATVAEINKADGKFVKGDFYVFAYDINAIIMAHPVNPGLIGKNLLEVPDANGELFRKDIVELAQTQGTGWVDFKYKNPRSNELEDKTTFFKKTGDLIISCSVYKEKK